MSWTDERVDTLKRLWGEGHSASQIANQLGGVSRNAVIGKVHRLGLESRLKKDGPAKEAPAEGAAGDAPLGNEPPSAEAAEREPVAVETAAEATPDPTHAPATGDTPPFTPANDPGTPAANGSELNDSGANGSGASAARAGGTEGDDVVVPVPLKLKLTQLTERTCKWPVGDPMHDDFHFCGHEAEEGRPYCEYHSGLAFQPASERRRVR